MAWHGYFAAQDLNLTAGQRSIVWDVLGALIPERVDKAQFLLARRWNDDRSILLLEAQFKDADVSIAAFRQMLADAFGVAVESIDVSQNTTQYGPVWTFARNATNYLRVAIFGNTVSPLQTDWQTSRDLCAAYIAANSAAWDGE